MRIQFVETEPEDKFWLDILQTLYKPSEAVKKELYDTQIIRLIDYIWDKYFYWLLVYNAIYASYPVVIITLLAFTDKSLHDNWEIAIYFTIVPAVMELFQIFDDPKVYFTSLQFWRDFLPLVFIVVFLLNQVEDHNDIMMTLLIIGMVLSLYRGLISVSIVNRDLMIIFRLIQDSIILVIPFAFVVIAQIILFAVLNSMHKIDGLYKEGKFEEEGTDILRSQIFNHMMMIIGGPKPDLNEDEYIRNVLYIFYQLMMNIISMKLLISLVGQAFGTQRMTLIFKTYDLRVYFLKDLVNFVNIMKNWSKCRKSDGRKCCAGAAAGAGREGGEEKGETKFLHWFVYKDQAAVNH